MTPLKKFYRWKYSGWIVIPVFIAIAWGIYEGMVQQNEFFDGFSCEMLKSFDRGISVRGHVISELDEEQREHFNVILNECQ
jgi:hypothetical protein